MNNLDPDSVRSLLQRGLFELNGEEVQEEVSKLRNERVELSLVDNPENRPLVGKTEVAEYPLYAYLASALTGLSAEDDLLIRELSDIASVACAHEGIDLYEPGQHTHPSDHPDHDAYDVHWLDKTRVCNSDLMIVLCHKPSFGAGEELQIALEALVPTILIRQDEIRISRMVAGIPSLKVEIAYPTISELKKKLQTCLRQIKPVLLSRKQAFADFDKNLVGERVRMRREELGLTRSQVAKASHIKEKLLVQIEESTDKVSNPSLLQLRSLSAVLKLTVLDLVEPDPNEVAKNKLHEWVASETAARSKHFTRKDKGQIAKVVLETLIDELVED